MTELQTLLPELPESVHQEAQRPAWSPAPSGGRSVVGRYLAAVVRWRWIVILAAVLGSAAALAAWRRVQPDYLAHGSLWVSEARPSSDNGPIREGEILQSSAWLDLLRSAAVLSPVVMQERLYLTNDPAQAALFASFTIEPGPSLRSGDYRLEVAQGGGSYSLLTRDGDVLETASVGGPIGAALGFRWVPPRAVLTPGLKAEFDVVSPEDATDQLSDRLVARIDELGSFIQVDLSDVDRRRAVSVLTAVMERDVEVAGQLKRSRLDETTRILSEQLESVARDLRDAEGQLESFRVRTITLPTDVSLVAPGVTQNRARFLDEFFELRGQLDVLRKEDARLAAGLVPDAAGSLRVAALEQIPAVQRSSELTRGLQDLAVARAALVEQRQLYTNEHEAVRDAALRVATLEKATIPAAVRSVLAELRAREAELDRTVAGRSTELTGIPRRVIEEARLERSVKIANDLYLDLRQRFETSNLAMRSAVPDVQILDHPSVPDTPEQDDRARWAALVFAVVLMGGLGTVLMLDRWDPRLRDPIDVNDEIGLSVLATVPHLRPKRPGSEIQVREAFRDLRTNLEFAFGTVRPMVLCVTSPSAQEGKSFVARHLAMALAGMGRRTLLVDGDTRRGDLHETFKLLRRPGLTDFLAGGRQATVPLQTPTHENLWVLSSGARSSGSPEMLNSRRMQDLLAAAKRRFDVVIFDSPPLSAGADAFVLAAHAGSLLVVLRSGSTNKSLTLLKMEPLLRLPVRILGAVLNDFAPSVLMGNSRYYGTYLDGYAATDEALEGSGAPRAIGAST